MPKITVPPMLMITPPGAAAPQGDVGTFRNTFSRTKLSLAPAAVNGRRGFADGHRAAPAAATAALTATGLAKYWLALLFRLFSAELAAVAAPRRSLATKASQAVLPAPLSRLVVRISDLAPPEKLCRPWGGGLTAAAPGCSPGRPARQVETGSRG